MLNEDNQGLGTQLDDKVSALCIQILKKSERFSEEGYRKIKQCLIFAIRAHEGQLRQSGEAYIVHPINVALSTNAVGLDVDAICAALLHDVVEDCSVEVEEIKQKFGQQVANLVDGLTKISELKLSGLSPEKQIGAESLRKMVLAMSIDLRVIIIKICDRLHNMRTLAPLKRKKALLVCKETREIYAPIASRLGLGQMRDELLNLSFETVHPWRAKILKKELDRRYLIHKEYVEKAALRLLEGMENEGIEGIVIGRRKALHAAYSKMKDKGLHLTEALDGEGFRVIVNSRTDCYTAAGVAHSLWKPLPGGFKDYVAIPKINGYKSLHTAVLNELGNSMEIQFRTLEMHRICEYGVCSHWLYKDGQTDATIQKNANNDAWQWLKSLLDIHKNSPHSDEFLDHIKTDLFSEAIYVFSQDGEVISLPRGACALDFAFTIHSKVGLFSKKAWINGELKDLSVKLRSGDRIKIEKAETIQSDPTWLTLVKTGRAKTHIVAHLHGVANIEATNVGLSILTGALADLGLNAALLTDKQAWLALDEGLGLQRKEVLINLASGQSSAQIVARFLGAHGTQGLEIPCSAIKQPLQILGEESDFIKMARCCSPLPPKGIKGLLIQNQGLVVHCADCKSMTDAESQGTSAGQVLALKWEPAALNRHFFANLRIKSKNVRGALAAITGLLAREGSDVKNVKLTETRSENGYVLIDFDIQVCSKFHLDRICEKLKDLGTVLDVT